MEYLATITNVNTGEVYTAYFETINEAKYYANYILEIICKGRAYLNVKIDSTTDSDIAVWYRIKRGC